LGRVAGAVQQQSRLQLLHLQGVHTCQSLLAARTRRRGPLRGGRLGARRRPGPGPPLPGSTGPRPRTGRGAELFLAPAPKVEPPPPEGIMQPPLRSLAPSPSNTLTP